MIRKFANAQVLDAWRVPAGDSARALRKAAHRVSFAYTPRPGYLYVRARAISSRCNDNWDAFPADEIEKGYRTFLGKPCFINHHNANHRRARGVIVAAALHRDRNPDGTPDTWVELLHEIDAVKFPKLAKAILSGRVNRTSMGVDCEHSTCSACGNKATSPAEYCRHMPAKKGMKFRKRSPDGKIREGIIHEICAGLTFFENSFLVEDPADPSAYVLDKPYLHPVTGAKTAAGIDLPEASCPNCGSPRARAHSQMHEMAQCSDCGTHYNHFTGREMEPDEVAVTHAAHENYEDYESGRKAGEELFRHFTPNYTHPHPGWDEAREWRDRANREDMQPHPMSGRPIPKYPGTHGHEDWAAQRREHVVHNWPGQEEFRIPEGPVRREHLSMRHEAAEDEPYMLRMMRHMTDAHGVPHDVLPFLAAQKYRDKHGRNIHAPGEEEGPEGEHPNDKIRRMMDTGRSMIEANEGIQLAHHELHGHDYHAEGGMTGTRHRHGYDDELAYRQERPYRPDSHRPGEEAPDPRYSLTEERAVLTPYQWAKGPVPAHMVQNEYKRNLHPDRTDEHPNREVYDQGDDPGQWSNLGNCSRTYTSRQQDRASRAASGEPDTRPDESKGETWHDTHDRWQAWHDKAKRNGAFCPECGAHKWMHAQYRPSEVGRPKPEWNEEGRREWDEKIKGKTKAFTPIMPHMSIRREAITGEEAEPGHTIWAVPRGQSPVKDELYHAMTTREPEDWHKGLSYHGPYHIVRHPETRHTHVVDAQGRNTSPFGGASGSFGDWEHSGQYVESHAQEHWHTLESAGPDAHRIGTPREPNFALMEERTPGFPHSRIDPRDTERAQRPDARVAAPKRFGLDREWEKAYGTHANPSEEWHGPYEVIKHPETNRYHVVDRHGYESGGMNIQGFQKQIHAERSRDYIDKRQQSKERGRALAGEIFGKGMEILDPGGTDESRESERNTQAGQELMTRYAGGRGKIKTDPDDEGGHPYYEREHMLPNGKGSGWYTKHYGGPSIDMYHRATGDTSHAMIHLPADDHDKLPDDFDDIELAKHIKAWHDDPQSERSYYENDKYGQQSEPKIHRWKRRQGARTHVGTAPWITVHEAAQLYAEPEDHPFYQANPVHKDHIKNAWYNHCTEDERQQGRHWYSDAHIVAKSIAHGDAALGAGVLAAYSPLTRWPANLFNAARSLDQGRAMGSQPGDGAIMGNHWRPAARIMAGEHHSDVLKGSKVRAFAHLIEHGGNTSGDIAAGTPKVVVDRHALSVAVGRRVSDEELAKAPLDKPRYYKHAEKQYVDAAREISDETGEEVDPSHVQAGTWLAQIRRNQAEDATLRGRLGRGRTTRGRQDAERWQDYHRQHHPDIPRTETMGETMHVGALQMMADSDHAAISTNGWTCNVCGGPVYGRTDEEGNPLGFGPRAVHSMLRRMAGDPPLRVPPSVDTLRPEACPVCGNSDVFKGQRCPVCGFVSPPDIFRDPDIDQARLNRQELEEGKEESPYPEGPADEDMMAAGMNPEEQIGSGQDADEQMFHPDQIAPDGIPGVQPEPDTPGQGMLEPGGDEEEPELDANGEPVEPAEGEMPPEDAQLEGEQLEEEGQEEQAEGEQLEEQGTEGEQAGEEAEEEGLSPGKEQDEDEERPGGKMPKRSAATTAATASDRAVAELRRENSLLHRQLQFIAELAGVGPEMEAIRRQADLANPAQPVDDPPQEPPVQSTEEALASGAPTGSGTGEARGPGHSEDDPSRPGTAPGSLTAVPAEQTTTAITPGVEIPTPPARQLIDVTAPIQGTNPSQDGGVPIEQRRIETDVRVNPNPLAAEGPGIGGLGNDGTAFPWTIAARQAVAEPASAEDERGARTFASIRLARLRVTAGLARGDELEVGGLIEKDANLTLRDIEHEISTLTQVSRTAAAAQPRYPRNLGPRQAARTAPSFAGSPVPAMAMTAGADTSGDDSDLFID